MERYIIEGKKKKLITEEEHQILLAYNQRRTYFNAHLKAFNIEDKICCASCGFPTFSEVDSFEICPICCWEENGFGDTDLLRHNHDANEPLTLLDYRLLIGKNIHITKRLYQTVSGFNKVMGILDTYDKNYSRLVDAYYTPKISVSERSELEKQMDSLYRELIKSLDTDYPTELFQEE